MKRTGSSAMEMSCTVASRARALTKRQVEEKKKVRHSIRRGERDEKSAESSGVNKYTSQSIAAERARARAYLMIKPVRLAKLTVTKVHLTASKSARTLDTHCIGAFALGIRTLRDLNLRAPPDRLENNFLCQVDALARVSSSSFFSLSRAKIARPRGYSRRRRRGVINPGGCFLLAAGARRGGLFLPGSQHCRREKVKHAVTDTRRIEKVSREKFFARRGWS